MAYLTYATSGKKHSRISVSQVLRFNGADGAFVFCRLYGAAIYRQQVKTVAISSDRKKALLSSVTSRHHDIQSILPRAVYSCFKPYHLCRSPANPLRMRKRRRCVLVCTERCRPRDVTMALSWRHSSTITFVNLRWRNHGSVSVAIIDVERSSTKWPSRRLASTDSI